MDRIYIRAANRILKTLEPLEFERLKQVQSRLEDFNSKCSDAIKNSRGFYVAVDRHLLLAADKIKTKIGRDIYDFTQQLQALKDFLNSDDIKLPHLGDIGTSLQQLVLEFGEANIDLKAKTISVTTESITLEGVVLGSFEIKLFIDRIAKLYDDRPYKIIALEPNPSGSDSDVTHPHVSHEQLCEGDGHMPIRKALRQGRICDFFVIIQQILSTYNPGSPYVSLDNWEGTSCYDCGYSVSGDECYYCDFCNYDFCSDCSTYCRICDATVCLGCSYGCPYCGKAVCKNCTAVCTECEKVLCTDCITEEGICQYCQDLREEKKNEEQEKTPTEPKAIPVIQSDSVGETRVSA